NIAKIVRKADPNLDFTIFEIGALPLGENQEPFYQILDLFPKSRIIAFEVDEKLCNDLNSATPSNIQYYPKALGERTETRDFFMTAHPMCASLFISDDKFIDLYNGLEVSRFKEKMTLDTVSIEDFAAENNIENIDFIKIDIQGAELDVFKGGSGLVSKSLMIVTEVEFLPLYKGQPLFGDVSAYLSELGLMFHKFLGVAGRTLKPFVINNDPNTVSQQMWSDAVFIRNVEFVKTLSSKELLKFALLSSLYNSVDLSLLCLQTYDDKNRTELLNQTLKIIV
ncbi:MAG: FkbM family methyltransferase, partial [Deltaproteobacteria bacterium]|nr:FkbM family methyltransferase [Deltaproteobacteria bacterium]